jgi:hypothetical protein
MVFFLSQMLCFAQPDSRGKRVENLKKTVPELWYVDQKPPLDTAKKDTVDIKSEPYSGRETVFQPRNLENFFNFLQYLFFAILAGAVLYLVVKSKFSFGRFSNSNQKVNEQITESTKIERIEDLERVDFQSQIEKAEAVQNYRLAIRLYYLWLIKNLSNAKFIDFQSNKTNRQYCNEMSGSKYFIDFEECTKYYNFVWFGEFGVTSDDYQKIIIHYKKLIGRFL